MNITLTLVIISLLMYSTHAFKVIDCDEDTEIQLKRYARRCKAHEDC